jgi:hypothetical protein
LTLAQFDRFKEKSPSDFSEELFRHRIVVFSIGDFCVRADQRKAKIKFGGHCLK